MKKMNYYNTAQHINSLIREKIPVNIEQVEINSGASVRFWIEPWLKTYPMERVIEEVENAYLAHSDYDFVIGHLLEGPVEIEVYNYPIDLP